MAATRDGWIALSSLGCCRRSVSYVRVFGKRGVGGRSLSVTAVEGQDCVRAQQTISIGLFKDHALEI
jgi:hypothetical protein